MEQIIRSRILELVKEYYKVAHVKKPFMKGLHKVNYAGRVYDSDEMVAATEAVLDFWLTAGKYCNQFEKEFASFIGAKHACLTNSGSSATLLAITSLMSHLQKNPLKAGDEVITPAVTFPTTLNPIIQNNLKPVFLDAELGTYNMDLSYLNEAINDKTRAIVIPHTLGNPNDMNKIMEVAEQHNLFVVEDYCDALGSKFDGKSVGTFGHVGTCSFYPAHHMTVGEGGAVTTNDFNTAKALVSLRDWGRDCWCTAGKNNCCGKRFEQQLGELPNGYDHKYVYSHVGYNLKALEIQGAIGLQQLKKIKGFIQARKDNFTKIYNALKQHEDKIILPKWHPKADVSWFTFPITVRDEANFTRLDFTNWLEDRKIETRQLFAGNIIKQPAYYKREHKKIGNLKNSDKIMNDTFFVGVYPGLCKDKIDYKIETMKEFLEKK